MAADRGVQTQALLRVTNAPALTIAATAERLMGGEQTSEGALDFGRGLGRRKSIEGAEMSMLERCKILMFGKKTRPHRAAVLVALGLM